MQQLKAALRALVFCQNKLTTRASGEVEWISAPDNDLMMTAEQPNSEWNEGLFELCGFVWRLFWETIRVFVM